jgi:integrase
MSAAMDKKKQLTAEQEAELTQLWKKLVKLYHPDRFANEPDKLEAYHKLTAAINQAKDDGDIETLQNEIAAVAELLKNLRESPDYELCKIVEQKPGVLDELATERAKQLETENAELEKQAERLAKKIKKLSGQSPS